MAQLRCLCKRNSRGPSLPLARDFLQFRIPQFVEDIGEPALLIRVQVREQALFVVDPLEYEKPKTKTLAELLAKLGVAEKKVLVLTAGAAHSHNVYLSGRNIPDVQVMRFADATAYEILWSGAVVVELPALGEAPEQAEGEGGADDA